jgi:hypothetical protein
MSYKSTLAQIMTKGPGFQDTCDPAWNELNDLITPEVLEDAFKSCQEVTYPGIEHRTMKTMERIEVKKAMIGRPDLGFKTNCDLMAFRIPTKDITEITAIVRAVAKQNMEKGNSVLVRGSVQDTKGVMIDTVQYMYVYHADLGYLAEYQIGHPFTLCKFKHDSAIRDGKPGAVDFDKASIPVYKIIKAALLGRDDGRSFEQIWIEGYGEEPSDEWKMCF